MSLTSEMNKDLAREFWEREATNEEKKLIKRGNWKKVEEDRNEIWAPGFVAWLEVFAKKEA